MPHQMGECPICHSWKRVLDNGNVVTHSDPEKRAVAMRFPPQCLGSRKPALKSAPR